MVNRPACVEDLEAALLRQHELGRPLVRLTPAQREVLDELIRQSDDHLAVSYEQLRQSQEEE